MTEHLRLYLEGEIDADEYMRRADSVHAGEYAEAKANLRELMGMAFQMRTARELWRLEQERLRKDGE